MLAFSLRYRTLTKPATADTIVNTDILNHWGWERKLNIYNNDNLFGVLENTTLEVILATTFTKKKHGATLYDDEKKIEKSEGLEKVLRNKAYTYKR